jgi:hypothetical protein
MPENIKVSYFSAEEMAVFNKIRQDMDDWDEAARIRAAEKQISVKIALNMLRDRLPKTVISQYTGLSVTELETLDNA